MPSFGVPSSSAPTLTSLQRKLPSLALALVMTCNDGHVLRCVYVCVWACLLCLQVHTFRGPHWCEYCANFMWGLIAQGVRCSGNCPRRLCLASMDTRCTSRTAWITQAVMSHDGFSSIIALKFLDSIFNFVMFYMLLGVFYVSLLNRGFVVHMKIQTGLFEMFLQMLLKDKQTNTPRLKSN